MARVMKDISVYQVASSQRYAEIKNQLRRAQVSLMLYGKQARKLLSLWYARHKQRQALSRLSNYHLKDIGLSRSDAMNEVNKPFWKE